MFFNTKNRCYYVDAAFFASAEVILRIWALNVNYKLWKSFLPTEQTLERLQTITWHFRENNYPKEVKLEDKQIDLGIKKNKGKKMKKLYEKNNFLYINLLGSY